MPEASAANIDAVIDAVAKRAGASTATVSRVLSRPEVVAPSTRRKMMRAVELLGLCSELRSQHGRSAISNAGFPMSNSHMRSAKAIAGAVA